MKDFIHRVASESDDDGNATKAMTCKADSTLGDVIDALASRAVHRIYVVGDDEEVVGVITLRDVISCFIYEPPRFLENFFGFPVAHEMLNH